MAKLVWRICTLLFIHQLIICRPLHPHGAELALVLFHSRQSMPFPVQPANFFYGEEALSDVFDLQHRAEHRTVEPALLCTLLSNFVDDTGDGWAAGMAPSATIAAVQTITHAQDVLMGEAGDTRVEKWWLEYGCALLSSPGEDGAAEPTRSYTLVGLDKWSAKIHSYPDGPSGETVRAQTATCNGSTVLFVGSSSDGSHLGFLSLIQTLMAKASSRTGKERSAAGGTQGHQKTPSFVEAVIKDARKVLLGHATMDEIVAAGSVPRGGFTDVGRHTGGEKRRTCWPLVREVHRHLVCSGPTACVDPEGLQRRFIAHFALWASEQQMRTVAKALAHSVAGTKPPLDNGAILVDSVVQMLEVATASAGSMVADGYTLSGFEERCKDVRQKLDHALDERNTRAADFYMLPSGSKWATGADPTIAIPTQAPAGGSEPSLSGTQEAAQQSIQWTRQVDLGGCSIVQLVEWLGQRDGAASAEIRAIDAVEQVMYAYAATLRAPPEDKHRVDVREVEGLIER
jgi:hypothetical protein